MTSWSSTPDDFTWTKEGAESAEPENGPAEPEPGEGPVEVL